VSIHTAGRVYRLIGFLLAKDSLIKSSHASHPIAGQGAAAWCGSGLSEYECFESGKNLGESDEGILRGHVGVKNLCPPISPSTRASILFITVIGRSLAARLRLRAGLTPPVPGPRKASRRPSPSSTSPLAVTPGPQGVDLAACRLPRQAASPAQVLDESRGWTL